jgi:acyl-CoA thioesterase
MERGIPLSEMIALRRRDGADVVFTVTDDWTQGRTVFGGLLSALGVQAMRDVAGADWPLRALQTNFVAPVEPGDVRFVVALLRQGKNVRQVQCTLLSAEGVAATLVGVFGADRESELPLRAPAQSPSEKTLEQASLLPFFKGISPNFTRQIDFHWAEGGFPYSHSDTWNSKVYLGLHDLGLDRELTTVMLADAPPTPAISRFNKLVRSSSVSWALELRVSRPTELHTGGHWRIDIDTKACANGYTNEVATLWTPDGEAAAFGYQVVAVFG